MQTVVLQPARAPLLTVIIILCMHMKTVLSRINRLYPWIKIKSGFRPRRRRREKSISILMLLAISTARLYARCCWSAYPRTRGKEGHGGKRITSIQFWISSLIRSAPHSRLIHARPKLVFRLHMRADKLGISTALNIFTSNDFCIKYTHWSDFLFASSRNGEEKSS